MSKEIKDLKKQIIALESRIKELEGGNKRYYIEELKNAIAKALGCNLEEFEGEDEITDLIYNHLPNILNPEIASYIAGFHVGVSLVEGSITGIVDESFDFYESFADYFEKVGFENFQLGFGIPYYDGDHHLSLDRLLEKFCETSVNKSVELRQVISKLENYAFNKVPTEEEALQIIECYFYYVGSKFLK